MSAWQEMTSWESYVRILSTILAAMLMILFIYSKNGDFLSGKKPTTTRTSTVKKGQKLGTLKGGATPVRTGKWQIMINGESYKRIVAEAGKLALGEENILERCFIVEILNDKDDPTRVAGAVGFSLRENKVYIINAKVIMCACGGAVNVYQPRSVGEGKGRAWYPVWNAGSTYTMALRAGAELSMICLLYTSDAADDTPCVDLGGRRIIKKKKKEEERRKEEIQRIEKEKERERRKR
eukprot:TRINITY_DN12164_c0_g1_i3.p2 TRINITY_DN12164_c0_g1~~TRINITY_DN12164_c0_g1_i3.p2  ORF type:complete len:237 (-),score=49.12 TRINITY_DN12164_c0_g1_i3:13-723(-)